MDRAGCESVKMLLNAKPFTQVTRHRTQPHIAGVNPVVLITVES